MADLIPRAAAIEAVRHAWAKGLEPSQYIEIVPAVDAVPVVHAIWKAYSVPHWTKRYDDNGDPEYKYHDEYVCSICRRRTIIKENYCPNCGAKMDGERRDDE